jgi:hypothetical protein
MTLGHVRLEPAPFNDGCPVASTDMSTEYEVILLTSKDERRSASQGRRRKIAQRQGLPCA